MKCYTFIKDHREMFEIQSMCRVLKVSRMAVMPGASVAKVPEKRPMLPFWCISESPIREVV